MHAPICMNAERHLLEGQHSIHANAPDEKLKAMIHEHIIERQGAGPQVPMPSLYVEAAAVARVRTNARVEGDGRGSGIVHARPYLSTGSAVYLAVSAPQWSWGRS